MVAEIVAAAPVTHVTTPQLRARRARELADIHACVCWAKRQGLRCSTCFELNGNAARLTELAEVA